MQLNRFMWEDVEKGVFRKNKRIRTVLKFENVLTASSKNVNQKKNDRFLDFLAIETFKMPDKNYEMNLIFSGDIVGQIFTMLIRTVAAAEAAIGLAIIVIYYRNKGSIRVEDIHGMKG